MVLRVTVVELPARWGEPERAVLEVEEILRRGPASDLVLLPEASFTGYVSPDLDFDLTPFAEPIGGPTAQALSRLAREHRTHLFGPLILEERGRDGELEYFNATVGFAPNGEHIVTYRKRHPWIPEEWATPGREPYPSFDIAGVRVTIACCFDVHFLADEAREVLDEADLLLFPSAWVEEIDSRPRRLRAIAKKHHVAIAAANWGRGTHARMRIKGQGGSFILDANGDVLAKVSPGERRADGSLAASVRG